MFEECSIKEKDTQGLDMFVTIGIGLTLVIGVIWIFAEAGALLAR
jgi:hypothetical protein